MTVLGNTITNVSYAPSEAPTTPSTLTDSVQPLGDSGPDVSSPVQTPQAPGPQGGSRLLAILGAVAKVGSTALAGIPNQGRPSFLNGASAGARAEQAFEANQQAIKFKDLDTQIRLAELHNQDVKLQSDTQAQRDAHTAAELSMRQLANDMGVDYDTIANHGPAVLDHLTAQTAANGAASVPAGTHISGDGQSIYIPQDTQKTRDAQKQMYSALAPALGLPALPQNMDFVSQKYTNFLTNKMLGYQLNGDPIKHDDLPGIIGAEKAQRENIAKNGATPQQLKALDNVIAVHQASLDALDEHKASVLNDVSERKQNEQTNAAEVKGEQTRQTNAAKPQNPQSGEWKPKVSADEKKKAELAENMVFNANNIAAILQRRPDIVGKVAGRITSVQQMAGTNDPDIVQLATDIHNIAMANNGIHGLRSAEAVNEFENKLLNNFKNGPRGIAGGLRGSVNSVQTFIDNARPDTYKTHSKNGGAIKAMVPNQ